jgi:transposase
LPENSWLLGIQFADRQKASVYPLKGGDSEGLMAKLAAACDRWTKVNGKKPSLILCYEAGYDAFWLARFLKARGIECLVVDSASMQVDRRSRRAKTDRIDLAKLLRALIAWCGGERHVCSVVRTPSVDEEDLRRSHRERSRLINERKAHVNCIKGLLFAQGIRGINVKARYKTLQIDKLVTGEGRPLPPRLAQELSTGIADLRWMKRWATMPRRRRHRGRRFLGAVKPVQELDPEFLEHLSLSTRVVIGPGARSLEFFCGKLVQQQIAAIEQERDKSPATCKETEKKRVQLLLVKGIGPTFSAVMACDAVVSADPKGRLPKVFPAPAPTATSSCSRKRSPKA